jgi:hypothetical protein
LAAPRISAKNVLAAQVRAVLEFTEMKRDLALRGEAPLFY